MTRAVLLLPATVFITSLVITILPPAAADCGCARYTTCSDCDGEIAGPCCDVYGACGSGGGYCEPCFCSQYPENRYVACDDCHCLGTCASHNIIVATYDDDHHRNHSSSSSSTTSNNVSAAAPTPSWHLMENMSSSSSSVTSSSEVRPVVHRYGSAAVCGQSAMDLANTVVPGQCLEVTNLENGKHAMVRVTGHKQYHCSNTSLLLERGVFQQLVGTSGGGHGDQRARHFPINYKYVRCIGN
ncbi:unnamed protein product [Linum trigynum]|uniref:Uncharacterized protein n=1 Tax=Linum trigynum TaxID=586398 RepID=A0AAV2GWC1_9ROSI